MSMDARAAQFSSFAALTGHKEALQEAIRTTDDFRELSADHGAMLDSIFAQIRDRLSEKPIVRVTYYQPDRKKAGGRYHRASGEVVRLNEADHYMELSTPRGALKIPFKYIIDLDA